jgi:hypothetical protein
MRMKASHQRRGNAQRRTATAIAMSLSWNPRLTTTMSSSQLILRQSYLEEEAPKKRKGRCKSAISVNMKVDILI